jgi:hypothetical protein
MELVVHRTMKTIDKFKFQSLCMIFIDFIFYLAFHSFVTSHVATNVFHDLYDMYLLGSKTFQLNWLIAKLPISTMWEECNKNYMCYNLWPKVFSFKWPHYWTLTLVHLKSWWQLQIWLWCLFFRTYIDSLWEYWWTLCNKR